MEKYDKEIWLKEKTMPCLIYHSMTWTWMADMESLCAKYQPVNSTDGPKKD